MLVFHTTLIQNSLFHIFFKEKRQHVSLPITDTITFTLLNAGNFNALCVMDIKTWTTVGLSFFPLEKKSEDKLSDDGVTLPHL